MSESISFPVPDEFIETIAERAAEIVLEREQETVGGSPWLSVAGGAAYLGISERMLQRAITKGKVTSSTIGRRRLLHRDELDRFARAAGEE